jgi:hypothetical protein
MVVGETTVTLPAGLPPKVTNTWVPGAVKKLLPEMVTGGVTVPVTGPVAGLTPLTIGAGGAG